MTLTPWLPKLLLEAADAIRTPDKTHRINLVEDLVQASTVVRGEPTKWIVLYTGTNEWFAMEGTREEAEYAATVDHSHLDYNRTGYRLIPDIP